MDYFKLIFGLALVLGLTAILYKDRRVSGLGMAYVRFESAWMVLLGLYFVISSIVSLLP